MMNVKVTDDSGKTVFRSETPSIARELDDKVREGSRSYEA